MFESIGESDENETLVEKQFSSVRELFSGPNDYLSSRIDKGIQRFLTSTDKCSPFNREALINRYSSFNIPDVGVTFKTYFDYLESQIVPDSSHLASARYLGHMTCPVPHFIPEVGRLIQSLNQNMVKMETSRGLTILERQSLSLIHKELFGFNQAFYDAFSQDFTGALGIFTSGGTLANISALWAACRNVRAREGNRIEYIDQVVIGSELMHYSFDKAAEILGLNLIKLPVDKDNSISPADLKNKIIECEESGKNVIALIGIAGSTDFGSIDPLVEICRLGEEKNIYVHIDAAWGGGFLLSQYKDKILSGIELADSVTIDGHKQLMMPIGCGLLLFRDPALSKKIAHHAPYAAREKSLDQGRYTLEGTRPANTLYLHACLNIIGRNGYREIFKLAMQNAGFMADVINDNDSFELTSSPIINILTYRYVPKIYRRKKLSHEDNFHINEFNKLLQKAQRAKGNSFVSRTTRPIAKYGTQKLVLLRAVLINPLTTRNDINYVINEQLEIAHSLEKP
ncbi:aminotransferase class V-fold PLP-dependent enzyme [Brenneria sp. g21c3]|uniref:aminotransferase class V-fold PLP-dependent enzyme n=1 Tax=Brenneria sp. g21c3 TaxID=3093893 RepID=UPI002EADFA24|nr:aminotransferase class V-fold PLP-dependent enzyme [Brenneria sp. g21c3]